MLEHSPCASAASPGAKDLPFNRVPTSEEEIIACFGTRSVHTVMKRANTFSAFLRWLDVVSSANPSAFCDAAYWKYLKFLESSGAAASSAASFLASVRFCKFVMGLTGTEEPSRRCVGLAEKLAAQAGVVRQAEALTVEQLLIIHDTLHDPATSRWDKAFSAYALVALYGRARRSDLKRVERVEWDLPMSAEGNEAGRQGYIIIYTRHHKPCDSKESAPPSHNYSCARDPRQTLDFCSQGCLRKCGLVVVR